MDKYITYKEIDLKHSLALIKDYTDQIREYCNLMKEKVEGKRDNIDLSIYKDILYNIIYLESELDNFKIDLE